MSIESRNRSAKAERLAEQIITRFLPGSARTEDMYRHLGGMLARFDDNLWCDLLLLLGYNRRASDGRMGASAATRLAILRIYAQRAEQQRQAKRAEHAARAARAVRFGSDCAEALDSLPADEFLQ